MVTAMLDGEVVVESESGAPSFTELQADLSAGRSDRFRYYLFDLLHLDGTDLRGAPLIERKAALARLLDGHNGILTLSEHFEGGGATILEHACRLGLEGIVSKLKTGTYRSGRTKSWIKAKCAEGHDLAIIGYVPSTTQRRAIGSLVVAAAEPKGNLRYAGRVGSGYSSAVAEDLWRRLEGLRVPAPPLERPPPADVRRNVRWVRPALVAEVEFRGWTADGIVRHAVFKGLRPDKEAADVTAHKRAAKAKTAAPLPVVLTHPDRVLWPAAGVTKQGLAEFYAEIWPWIAPHIVNRPLALVRCPGGVDETCFFQKHAFAGMSDQVARSRDPEDDEEILTVSNLEGLLSLVQASVLEIHVWGATLDDHRQARRPHLRPRSGAGRRMARRGGRGPGGARPPEAQGARQLRQDHRRQGPARLRPLEAARRLGRRQGLRPQARRRHGRRQPGEVSGHGLQGGPPRPHLRRLPAQRPRRHRHRRLLDKGAGRGHRLHALGLGRAGPRDALRPLHGGQPPQPPRSHSRPVEGPAQEGAAAAVSRRA